MVGRIPEDVAAMLDDLWGVAFKLRNVLVLVETQLSGKDGGDSVTPAGNREATDPGLRKSGSPSNAVPANPAGGTKVPSIPPPTGGAFSSFKEWLVSPEAQAIIQQTAEDARKLAPKTRQPFHEDGTPVSVGERVERGRRVFTYTGPCENCGNPAYTTSEKLAYPAGSYKCWDCYRRAKR